MQFYWQNFFQRFLKTVAEHRPVLKLEVGTSFWGSSPIDVSEGTTSLCLDDGIIYYFFGLNRFSFIKNELDSNIESLCKPESVWMIVCFMIDVLTYYGWKDLSDTCLKWVMLWWVRLKGFGKHSAIMKNLFLFEFIFDKVVNKLGLKNLYLF